MIIEITPTTGHQPKTQALDLLMARANERCNKPQGINLQVDDLVPLDPVPVGHRQWQLADLNTFEQKHVKLASTPDRAVLNILYLDGTYGPNAAAIAISYTGHSIAIFTDMLGPNGPEGAALVHELGHQLGLVNGTTKQLTPHEDTTHPLHDINQSCVMFFSLDPRGDTASPTDYCDLCKADLEAAGGKPAHPSPN